MAKTQIRSAFPLDVRPRQPAEPFARFSVSILNASWVLPRSIPAHLVAVIRIFDDDQHVPIPTAPEAAQTVVWSVSAYSTATEFMRYFRDLQCLHVQIKDPKLDAYFASFLLPLDGLDPGLSVHKTVPVHDENRCLGHIEILLRAYFKNISSESVQDAGVVRDVAHAVPTENLDTEHVDEVLHDMEIACSKRMGASTLTSDISELLPLSYAAIKRCFRFCRHCLH